MTIAAPPRPRGAGAAPHMRARSKERPSHSAPLPARSAQRPEATRPSVPALARRSPLRMPALMDKASAALADSRTQERMQANRGSAAQASPSMRLRSPQRRQATASALPPLPAPWSTGISQASGSKRAAAPSARAAVGSGKDARSGNWDRCRISTSYPKTVVWHDAIASLDAPLPLDAPKLESIVEILGAACLDVLLGHRAVSSLRPWLTEEILLALKRRANLALRIKGRAPASQKGSVRKIFTSKVHERAWEVALVTHDGEKYRAMAMRVEFWNGRWRLMALDIG